MRGRSYQNTDICGPISIRKQVLPDLRRPPIQQDQVRMTLNFSRGTDSPPPVDKIRVHRELAQSSKRVPSPEENHIFLAEPMCNHRGDLPHTLSAQPHVLSSISSVYTWYCALEEINRPHPVALAGHMDPQHSLFPISTHDQRYPRIL